jgi:hypothetical protein
MTRLTRVLSVVGVGLALAVATPAYAVYRVAEGTTQRNGGLLTAGKDGAVLAFQSGLNLKLAPGAQLRQHKDTELWLDASGKSATEMFSLERGRADVRFAPVAPKRAVMIRTTRGLLAATTRGEFTVLAQADAGVVANSAGIIQVNSGGPWSSVPVGQAAVATRTVKLAMRELPQAPRMLPGRSLWIAPNGQVPVGGIEWAKTANASSYRLTVVNRETSELVVDRTLAVSTVPDGEFKLSGGVYALRTQALDEFGLAGPASEPRDITVLGVIEHRGSRVDAHGTIHVGLNQRVQFTNVTGLLMNYGGSTPWAPASSSLVLRQLERTRVHFRVPESSEVVSVVIEPRGIVADVYVGSKLATWPKENVSVWVRLHDETGAEELSEVEPRIEVRLGITPMPVTFRREGNLFRADVPPQAGPGPWVLRVTVQDQFGVELGRDSLEVAELQLKPKPAASPALADASGASSADVK